MTGAERGFLLLCSHLGNPDRRPLTTPQFRLLARRVREAERHSADRDLTAADLIPLGYGREDAERIVNLLEEEFLLDRYLEKAGKQGCHPMPRITAGYPARLAARLGDDAPRCLWYRGNPALLERPCIALVGSRDLAPENREFARLAGIQAAEQGYVLISGNARGADRTAQESCLAAGGSVICVVADELDRHQGDERRLYLSEDGFDLEFSAQRALSRNRVIHALGEITLVAQSGLEKGGTWDGTAKNLRHGWSPVFCFDDGSLSTDALEQLGAILIGTEALKNLSALPMPIQLF